MAALGDRHVEHVEHDGHAGHAGHAGHVVAPPWSRYPGHGRRCLLVRGSGNLPADYYCYQLFIIIMFFKIFPELLECVEIDILHNGDLVVVNISGGATQ